MYCLCVCSLTLTPAQAHKEQQKAVPKALADQCTNMSLLLVLKNFLKVLYCLSERYLCCTSPMWRVVFRLA